MRRITLLLVLSALVALGGGSSTAAAAPAETFHFQFNGSFAEALWETQTSSSFTDTFVFAQKDKRGNALLFLDEFTENFDSNGNFTGATDVFGEADSGVSFSVAGQLSSATASATVPVTSCSYDADFNLIGCSDAGTVDVSANWTGEGPIARGTFNQNFHQDGFHEVDHFTGTDRQATATATVDGTSLGTGDLLFADLGTAVSGTVIICHNC
jgi:hypothetical protein